MFLRPPDIKPKILGLWGLSGLVNCQCLPFINAVLFEWSGIRDHVFQSTTAESAPSVRFCNPWHGFCHSPNIHSSRQSFLFFFFFFILIPLPSDEIHSNVMMNRAVKPIKPQPLIRLPSSVHYFWKLNRQPTAHLLILLLLLQQRWSEGKLNYGESGLGSNRTLRLQLC